MNHEADPLLSAKATAVNSTAANAAITSDSLLDDLDDVEQPQQTSGSESEHTAFSCSEFLHDIADLPRAFWLLCLAIVLFYGAYSPFLYVAEGFFESK